MKTVSAWLQQLKIGVKAIIDNIRTEIDELSTGTDYVIGDTKKNLEQERTMIAKMLKSISSLKSPSSTISTISTNSPAKPQPTNY